MAMVHVLLSGGSLAFSVLIFLLLAVSNEAFGAGCAFYRQTGLYCPGCGGTRAALLLVQGRIFDSLQHNCLCPLFLIAIAYLCLCRLSRNTSWEISRIRIGPRVLFGLLGILAAFLVLRNIPAFPFNCLAPS